MAALAALAIIIAGCADADAVGLERPSIVVDQDSDPTVLLIFRAPQATLETSPPGAAALP